MLPVLWLLLRLDLGPWLLVVLVLLVIFFGICHELVVGFIGVGRELVLHLILDLDVLFDGGLGRGLITGLHAGQQRCQRSGERIELVGG